MHSGGLVAVQLRELSDEPYEQLGKWLDGRRNVGLDGGRFAGGRPAGRRDQQAVQEIAECSCPAGIYEMQVRENESEPKLCNASDVLAKVLKVTKLDSVFDIHKTRRAAIESFQIAAGKSGSLSFCLLIAWIARIRIAGMTIHCKIGDKPMPSSVGM